MEMRGIYVYDCGGDRTGLFEKFMVVVKGFGEKPMLLLTNRA